MRKQVLLTIFLIVSMIIGFQSMTFATLIADIEWYVNAEIGATNFVIDTSGELLGLVNIVNGTAINNDGEAISADTFKNKTITLNSDIDLIDIESWNPIGTTTNKFCGTFDGKGYSIKNMIINTSENYQGLFGCIGDGATIKNLIIDNSCSIKGGSFTAGLIGGSQGSGTITIENCGN